MEEKVAVVVRGFVRPELIAQLRELLKGEPVTIIEKKSGFKANPSEQKILKVLGAREDWVDTTELEQITGVKGNTLRPALQRLSAAGLAQRDTTRLAGPAWWRATDSGREWAVESGEK